MKKSIIFLLTMIMTINLLTGCKSIFKKSIDELIVYLVPTVNVEKMNEKIEPLQALLKEELANEGYKAKKVTVKIGDSNDLVGEALASGEADVAFIPGSVAMKNETNVDIILSSTRPGLSKDSEKAADWNDGTATVSTDKQVTYSRSIIIAGQSDKGKALAKKVNSGQALTAADLTSAKWAFGTDTSPAGYIYPAIWLQDEFKLNIKDITNFVQCESYDDSMKKLANKEVDLVCIYADGRIDYAEKWNSTYGKTTSIWSDLNVIGVTCPIYNDTISVTKNSDVVDDKLKAALQKVFIKIAETESGKDIISIYNHTGYKVANNNDYSGEKEAQQIVESIK